MVRTVSGMDKPHQPGELCAHCNHALDPHTMMLVIIEPVPAGILTCPEPGCDCFSTWAARGRRSTPEEARAIRATVIAQLNGRGHLN